MAWLEKQIAHHVCFIPRYVPVQAGLRKIKNKNIFCLPRATMGRSMGRNKAAATALFSITSKLKARNCSWIS
jgi:hypothetical protein